MDSVDGMACSKTTKIPVSSGRKDGHTHNPSKLKIYTDWANHYLEKARSKRYISDLQQDVTDGVLLADVIEAVTNEKLQDIKTKPKNSTQMVENITTCLTFLVNLGVNIDGITAKDIRDGNLKAILGLFFALSRHKQQQKTQQQQQKQEQQRHQQQHAGEITDNHVNGKNVVNGEENQTRLPSYSKQSSKCPTTAHPSSRESGQGRSKSQGQGSKARQHNQQNSGGQQPQTGPDVNAGDQSTAAQRATSPACSGIPTPGGRTLGPRSQSAGPEKSQIKPPQSSTPTPQTQKSSSGIPANKQNSSMLEKFKLFNTKEKTKGRSGLTKSSSKTNSAGSTSTSTLSTSSRSDTSSSLSARSSSSADAGPSSSATSTNDPDSPKLSKPRPIVGGVISARRENIGGLTIGQQQSRQTSPSPYSSSLPSTPTSSLPISSHKKSGGKSQKSSDAQSRSQHAGHQTPTKGGKQGSLIPKSGGKSQKSSSTLSLTSSSGGSQLPVSGGGTLPSGSSGSAPGSSIPAPGSSSIPKPGSGKSSKSGKEEKMRGTGSSKDHGTSGSMSHLGPPNTPLQTQSLTRRSKQHSSSSQHQQLQLQQQQQHAQQMHAKANAQHASQGQSSNNISASLSSSAPPVPPHRNGSQLSDKQNNQTTTKQMVSKGQSSSHSRISPNDGPNSQKTRYTEIEYTDGRIERVGEGHFAKPTNQAITSSVDGRGHPYMITSQSVNVVKPTCSTPHSMAVKSESNAPPSLSIIHNRSAIPPPLPKTEPPPSTRTTVNNNNTNPQTSQAQSSTNQKSSIPGSQPQTPNSAPAANTPQSPDKKGHLSPKAQDSPEANHSTSSSSNDSVILNTSVANSPRLGVKVLGSQPQRPANNIAIVQPHHGEKKETTFDTEVTTDVINKGDDSCKKESQKETTFSEKKTTFIADSGETLDIQPMQPINRSMHYAQGFMRGYASPNKPMPIAVAQNQCYAMTGMSPNRVGMNRSLLEANKFYSGSIRRATSSGSGNVSYDDYSSDYDTYDYISGYMSDGDILKGNKMDDMSSGYMSEGGASLYARRLQQRFREGMQAVKECMQKSSNVTDEDSFDSKRYQELQLQKQQILQKQRELEKIKEKKSKRRKPVIEGMIEEEPDTDGDTGGAESSASSSKSHSTHSLSQMTDGSDGVEDVKNNTVPNDKEVSGADASESKAYVTDDIKDDEMSHDSLADLNEDAAINVQIKSEVNNLDTVLNEPVKDVISGTKPDVSSNNTEVSDTVTSSEGEVKASAGDNDKACAKSKTGSNDPNSKDVTTPVKGLVDAKTDTKPTKEYAIIAKINKQAIIRGSEIVGKESESQSKSDEISVIVSEKDVKKDVLHCGKLYKTDKKTKAKSVTNLDETGQQMKTNTQAYAVIDLDKTMSYVKNLEEKKDKTDKLKDKSTEKGKESTAEDSASAILAKADKLSERAQQIQELREQIYAKKYARMSRSAGYNGDMDTSCSSLEPDIDTAVDKFLSSKLSGSMDDRLIITEEQLSTMQYVGSSSSGFDDSSSISSGDISDTINEISTDEGNVTGGSGQDANPYSSLKRGPKDLFRNLTNANLHASPGKRVPNLGTSAFLGSDYASDVAKVGDVPHVGGWRKYSLQNNRLLSSDPADYAYLYNGYEQWRGGSVTPDTLGSLRKISNTSQPDIHSRSQSTSGDYAGSEKGYPNTKCDSETNTDQSHIYDASVRKMQNIQNARAMQSAGVGYGYGRRPLSNTSTGSVGSSKSAPGGPTGSPGGSPVAKPGSTPVGARLAKHGLDQIAQQYHNATSKQLQEQSKAAQQMRAVHHRDGTSGTVPEYSSASLERRTKSSSAAQTEMEMFKSNSLGRRKGGLGTHPGHAAENANFCASTIISNPHATYSKPDGSRHNSPYSSVHIPAGYSGNYVPLEYAMGSPRNSGNANNWIRTNSGAVTADGRHIYHHVSDSESMDTLSSASSINARIQQARALSSANARILAQSGNYGLHRSNSMKSTQSESAYSSPQHHPHHHTDDLPSPPPPTSPTPSNSSHSSRFTYPMTQFGSSPAINPAMTPQTMVRSNTSSSLPYSSPLALSKINREEEDSIHGSSLSLVSSSSSVYSTAEEKQAHEIRKLRRELDVAYDKVSTLTTQLSTNQKKPVNPAHVVAAFEQSLSNMTSRLQHLTSTSEQKDSELNELRATIEALKRQSGLSIQEPLTNGGSAGRRHTTPGMLGKDLSAHHAQGEGSRIQRQISSDSMSSINSMSSACSFTSQQSAATDGDAGKKKKKKGWLRSSFTKAFTAKKKNRNGSLSDCEMDTNSLRSTMSVPNSPLLQVHLQNGQHPLIKGSHSSGALSEGEDSVTIMELRKQLRDKDMKLTDIRLEALSSAHQLEQLREAMNKMKNEMSALKSDNDRLNRMIHSTQTLNTSQNSLVHHNRTSSESLERTISLTENTSIADLLIQSESPDREGRRVPITVYLGSNPDPNRARIDKAAEVPIGSLAVSGKTKWDILDNIVRKIFKEYVLRIDPVTNLGLSAESVFSYHIGDIVRTKDSEVPELLPIGYLVGDTMQIGICLKGTRQNSVDSLAFETLIPKSIVQRYISLLMEHRRIILCGPSGTGKTYLAQKLAEHLVLRSGKELTAGSVATFNVDHKSAKELRQYLANIAEQCENTSMGELPSVIILDNLHHVGSLGEVFNGFLSVKYQKCPYIIGTMNQATCSTTNLQLHHNFRWVLCANHMEPVKGFLGRYLRRRLVEAEVMTSVRNNDLNKIIDWVPKVWLHLNKFLETHSSSDVTIGPRLFLSAPMEISGCRIWFQDLWNYSIVPYMLEAVREGLQVYGRRAPWEDPTDWVLETFPWGLLKEGEQILLKIRQEDVGYDTIGLSSSENNSPKIQNKNKEEITVNDSEGESMVSDV